MYRLIQLVEYCKLNIMVFISTLNLISILSTEFTCWLIAELVTVEGSETVNKANVNLQVTIMQILATRSPLLFSGVMADYINIGLGNSSRIHVKHFIFSVLAVVFKYKVPNCL